MAIVDGRWVCQACHEKLTSLSINPWDLKPLVERHGAEGAVVLAIKGDKYQVVSFGRDKKQCRRFARIVDDLNELIQDGALDCDDA